MWRRGRLGSKLLWHGANFNIRNGAFIVFGCVVKFLPFCCPFSHFKRLKDMSVKVKDVLDALQQMQKSLECSIWYECSLPLSISSYRKLIIGDKLLVLMQPAHRIQFHTINSTCTFSLSCYVYVFR